MKKYSDCYTGCGGEDCACCEIHHDHLTDDRYPLDSDNWPEHRPNYMPDDDDCCEDCDECPYDECECRRYHRFGLVTDTEMTLEPFENLPIDQLIRDC